MTKVESEAAECNVRKSFGNGKDVALGIRQAWQGRGMQGGRGF